MMQENPIVGTLQYETIALVGSNLGIGQSG